MQPITIVEGTCSISGSSCFFPPQLVRKIESVMLLLAAGLEGEMPLVCQV